MKKALVAVVLIVISLVAYSKLSSAGEHVPCSGKIVLTDHVATIDGTGDCLLLAYRYADGVAPGADYTTTFPQTYASQGTTSVKVPQNEDGSYCGAQIDLVQSNAEIAPTLTIDQSNYYHDHGWFVDAVHTGDLPCSTPSATTTTTIQPVVVLIPPTVTEAPPATPVHHQASFTG